MGKKIVIYKGIEMEVRSERKEWRTLFTSEQRQKGIGMLADGKVIRFQADGNFCEATVKTSSNLRYEVSIRAPHRYDEEWSGMPFICSCKTSYHSRYINLGGRRSSWFSNIIHEDDPGMWAKCDHMAPVMFQWEQEHGPWIVEETEEELEERYQAIERERKQKLEDQEWERDRKILIPVSTLADWSNPQSSWYDLESAMNTRQTNRYFANRFRPTEGTADVKQSVTAEGHQITYELTAPDGSDDRGFLKYCTIKLALTNNRITRSECSGRRCKNNALLCHHQLEGWNAVLNWIKAHPVEDQTDNSARKLFERFIRSTQENSVIEVIRREREIPRRETVDIAPRLIEEDTGLFLGYKVGHRGGRLYVLKAPEALLSASDSGESFPLGKNEELDFKTETFVSGCRGDLDQLRQLAGKRNFNDRGFASDGYVFLLSGALLDTLYDLHQGDMLEYENRKTGEKGNVRILHSALRMSMRSEPIRDIHRQFIGMRVSGKIPSCFKGKGNSYCLQASSLSRLSEEEKTILEPFSSITKTQDFSFRIGAAGIPDFYRRVLPAILSLPGIRYEDECRDEAEQMLPAEPSFSFYLSLEKNLLQCRGKVTYQDTNYPLLEENRTEKSGFLRDTGEEKRIREALSAVFPRWDPALKAYVRSADDESLFLFLHEGMARLEAMGTVYATQAVQNLRMEHTPSVKIQVSVASGLLNLDIRSTEYSREELLAILDSYEKKKTYYRLHSGAFVDLTDDEPLYEFETLLKQLRINPSDALRGQLNLPVYRTLYLDRMLEERDALQVSRDRMYRALIKNFNTIRDADWEIPAALADILRPYQQYGFKWLKTLYAAGFGGILADEMGLGKTVQAISLLQSEKDSGAKVLALIVCPASLVFNWKEEIRRFAPGLKAEALTGGAAQRNAVLRRISAEEKSAAEGSSAPDILLISYEMLRRNISHFATVQFTVCILDEAQYIKNQSAAVSKAVRLIHADHRYALTGTPIENRLSELWSIFDFLMPGFLYRAEEFQEQFEEPITRKSDTIAAQTLRQMTSPFILRRLKTDVLKELPPKLEEVRYVSFGDEQQAIYDAQVLQMRELLHSSGTRGKDKMQIFAGLLRLRQICCDPSLYLEGYAGESAKREGCLELIQSGIDGGHRMLVFSQFTSMLELLEQDLNREGISYLKMTGATPKERRLGMVNEFNSGDIPVFLISLKAGGTGLNLTGADLVIHYDPWWNLAAQNQATDRAHRIGQTKRLTVYRLIAQGTIEERILELQNTKKDLADSILSGDHTSLTSLSTEELLALLQ